MHPWISSMFSLPSHSLALWWFPHHRTFPAISSPPSRPDRPFSQNGRAGFSAEVEQNCSYETVKEILAGVAMGPRALAASAGLAPWSMAADWKI